MREVGGDGLNVLSFVESHMLCESGSIIRLVVRCFTDAYELTEIRLFELSERMPLSN